MRYETIVASQYLVSRLEYAQVVKDMRDEGDIILVDLKSGEKLMLILVERGMSLEELQRFYRTNTEKNIYTLMLFWVDMLLPRDGSKMKLDDWLSVEVGLHQNKLYGYEVAGRDAFFFPVQMLGKGMERTVRYGNIVNYAAIGYEVVDSLNPYMPGQWCVANFERTEQVYRDHTAQQAAVRVDKLAVDYARLGLLPNADFEAVKRAYRTLARLYHPDVNTDANADERMKKINEAYQRIEKHIGNG
jgi:hypothetical protein